MSAVSTSFNTGSSFKMKGKLYTVEASRGPTRSLLDQKRQELVVYRVKELEKAYVSNDLNFIDLLSGATGDEVEEPPDRALISFPERERDAVKVKLAYLKDLCPGGHVTVRREDLLAELERVWNSLPASTRPEGPPAISTFYGWRKLWINDNYRPACLVNRFDSRGRRPAPIDPRLEKQVDLSIDEVYIQPNRPTVTETWDIAKAKVDRLNYDLPLAAHIPKPTRRQVDRAIRERDRFEVIRVRQGAAAALRATRVFDKKQEPLHLLDRVEIDHTPLDLICIADGDGLVLGRPHPTVIIDVASRMILAAWISFRPPNADVVLRALKQAILPKAALLEKYGVKGDWPAHGLMVQVVTDNGKELKGSAVERVATDLGFELVYCPKKQPRFKGVIERFLKEMNYRFVHLLPGTTFAKYYLRDEYESLKHAVIPVEDLRRFIYRWVVEIYHKHFHRTLQTCPLAKWQELAAVRVPVLPRRADVLDVLLTPTDVRQLSSKGIEINNLFYRSPELSELRLRSGNMPLTVKPNPDDMGHIHVLHPESKMYFTATSTYLEYASGLSQEQHDVFLKRARDAYAALPYERAVLQAKLEMFEEAKRMLAEFVQRAKGEQGAKAKPAVSTPKKRKSRSGVQTQALVDTIAQVKTVNEESDYASTMGSFEVSFEGLEGFASGQTDLFCGA